MNCQDQDFTGLLDFLDLLGVIYRLLPFVFKDQCFRFVGKIESSLARSYLVSYLGLKIFLN